jgi:uncharacterized protein (TIGR03067 family)
MSTQLILGLAVVVGAPVGKPDVKPAPPPSLVGEWAFDESWLFDGDIESCAGRTIQFHADGKYLCRQDGKHHGSGTYTFRTEANPAEVDWTETGMDKPIRGIWKVEGDTLTICLTDPAQPGRPSAFAAPAGSNCLLMTLKRVKKE